MFAGCHVHISLDIFDYPLSIFIIPAQQVHASHNRQSEV